MNEKEALAKIYKVLSNQQKILVRLAQAADANIEYLKKAAQITAVNTGFTATNVEVTAAAGSTVPEPASTVKIAGGYTVKVAGAPKDNATREKFIRQLKSMVQTQKPGDEQLSNLSVIFTD